MLRRFLVKWLVDTLKAAGAGAATGCVGAGIWRLLVWCGLM